MKADEKLLPEQMKGSLSKLERDLLFAEKKPTFRQDEVEESESSAGEQQWDPEFNIRKEKSRAFDALSKLVPQSELFLSASTKEKLNTPKLESSTGTNYNQCRRYDPTRPDESLIV